MEYLAQMKYLFITVQMIKFGKNRTKVCVLFYNIKNSVYTEIQNETKLNPP